MTVMSLAEKRLFLMNAGISYAWFEFHQLHFQSGSLLQHLGKAVKDAGSLSSSGRPVSSSCLLASA